MSLEAEVAAQVSGPSPQLAEILTLEAPCKMLVCMYRHGESIIQSTNANNLLSMEGRVSRPGMEPLLSGSFPDL